MIRNMELRFDFNQVKENKTDLVWKYQLKMISEDKTGIEIIHGYFKLDTHKHTNLDLTKYDKHRVKKKGTFRKSRCNGKICLFIPHSISTT